MPVANVTNVLQANNQRRQSRNGPTQALDRNNSSHSKHLTESKVNKNETSLEKKRKPTDLNKPSDVNGTPGCQTLMQCTWNLFLIK